MLHGLDSSADGLSGAEASARLLRHGPNAIRTHRVSALAVLGRQLNNAVLLLLAGTAVLSSFLGDDTQSIIIGVILVASIGWVSSTSTAPSGPPRPCIRGAPHRGGAPRRRSSSRSTSPTWCPATSSG